MGAFLGLVLAAVAEAGVKAEVRVVEKALVCYEE